MSKKVYYTHRDVAAWTHNIIRSMQKDNWKPDYIVGLTRGGLVPANMISQYLDCRLETLKVSFRDDADNCESNLWMAEDAFGYLLDPISGLSMHDPEAKKNILIVDDINDTGATLNWIRQDWAAGCLPNHERWKEVWGDNVRTAVLVDNQNSGFHDIDYSGIDINKAEDDVWVVFPWENWWE